MRLPLSIIVAALSGFIALSYEIVWVRVYGFMTEGTPESFGYLLGAYLAGLALGAFVARSLCRGGTGGRRDPLYALGWLMFAASIGGFFVVPLVARAVSAWGWQPGSTLPIFATVAALMGTALPLVAHYGVTPDQRAGSRVAYLYVGNITGSALGSLLTGFVILDVLTLREVCVALTLLGLLVSGALILFAAGETRRRLMIAPMLIAAAVTIAWQSPIAYDSVYERLQLAGSFRPGNRFAQIIENRSGVVTVTQDGIIYGNGSYDGQFNVDPHPVRDSNRVVRAYAVAAFHAAPRDILMIGLGSGSWLQVLVNHPDVESVTVVEINPGYVEAMRDSPVVASALDHPKAHIVIDDGRRWLAATDRRFDVIVQNTIVYWRAHATNLLSREYFELGRRRLKEGGVVYVNTTTSTAAQRTLASTFPYAWRFQNMVIAGDSPIVIDRQRWAETLERWHIDGRPVIDLEWEAGIVQEIVQQDAWRGEAAWENRSWILRRTHRETVITDDNMASEWWAGASHP